MPEPEWLDLDIVLKIHQKNLVRFGGASGLRDSGLLDSALARPQWLYEFDAEADLHRFAAAYAFGVVKNHPFVDGNKRVGYLSAYTFLRYNRWYVTATEREAVRAMLALASGGMSEADFAAWLRGHSEALEPGQFPASRNGESALGDLIEDRWVGSPVDAVIDSNVRDETANILKTLSPTRIMGELLLIETAEIVMEHRAIFRFERPFSGVDDRHLLKDCFSFDLHIPVYVEKGNWPEPHGPAHPGVFGDAFPAILSQLVGPGNVLTLHLQAVEPRFFDELTFIREVLIPRRLDYVLLPPIPDSQYPKAAAGNLLFEWPLDSAQDIVDQWFKGFLIEMEGYISRRSCLGELAKLYFQSYNASTIRELLRGLEFAFKLWLDNNGLFILSDKLPEEGLRKRLMDPNLDATIKAAIRDAT